MEQEALVEKRKKVVDYLLTKKVLVTKDALSKINFELEPEEIYSELSHPQKPALHAAAAEDKYPVKLLTPNAELGRKRQPQDFINYFNNRLKQVRKILQSRVELQSSTSIGRLLGRKERSSVSIIGIVSEKAESKNGNILLTLEDSSGTIKVAVAKGKPVYELAKNVVLDEVMGVTGVTGNNIIFATNIIFPDVPVAQELKHTNEEVYAVVVSDIHTGSKKFLAEEFQHFIKWLSGELGSEEQRTVAEKVGYIFIVGDVVDGVGIYPSQEQELEINDIVAQYDETARLLAPIPKDKKIIICPGNHDAVRLSEPQPPLPKDLAKSLYELPNTVMVTNPAMVNIHAKKGFQGFDVLMYHGYSYDHYGDTVESIRLQEKSISDRVDLVMKFLLQKRHLQPTHSSSLYIPDSASDPLVIERVPDFFLSGHIHKSKIANYRGVTIVSGSCWQSKTAFQEKVGHQPEPCKVPLINLQTRKARMISFRSEK